MRVLVCGGRDFVGQAQVRDALEEHNPSLVITGGAKGADSVADYAAAAMNIDRAIFPANWGKDGKAAGPIRNRRMLEIGKPDLVLAFPGGRGTANMISEARKAGVKVIEFAESAPMQSLF